MFTFPLMINAGTVLVPDCMVTADLWAAQSDEMIVSSARSIGLGSCRRLSAFPVHVRREDV